MTTFDARTPDEPTLEDHPGLDNDEAPEAGKMMTASGSTGRDPDVDENDESPERRREDRRKALG